MLFLSIIKIYFAQNRKGRKAEKNIIVKMSTIRVFLYSFLYFEESKFTCPSENERGILISL